MEFIEGETLNDHVKRKGPLPWRQALQITLQVAGVLKAAAKYHLVHRDIKPANLMLARHDGHDEFEEGDDFSVKVIDFGLAKFLVKQDANEVSLTGAGPVGTPYFMSPEQINPMAEEPDERSDIYSLGVTLWWMLAGSPPFIGTEREVYLHHLQSVLPLDGLPDTVPSAVRCLLAQMLEKDRKDRPSNATELRRKLKECLSLAHVPASEQIFPTDKDPPKPIVTCHAFPANGEISEPVTAGHTTAPIKSDLGLLNANIAATQIDFSHREAVIAPFQNPTSPLEQSIDHTDLEKSASLSAPSSLATNWKPKELVLPRFKARPLVGRYEFRWWTVALAITVVAVIVMGVVLFMGMNPQALATAYYEQGISENSLKKYEDAIKDYTEAIRLNPQFADAFNNRGAAYNKLQKYEEAIKDSTEAIRLNPQFANAFKIHAFAYRATGKPAFAQKDEEAAAKLP